MIYAQSVVIEGACSGYHYRGIMNNWGHLAPQGSPTNPTESLFNKLCQLSEIFNLKTENDTGYERRKERQV